MPTSSCSDRTDSIAAVVVAIPARDEAAAIRRCIQSIDAAAEACGRSVAIVVGADRCTDGTEAILCATQTLHATLGVVPGRWTSAGSTRRAIVDAALADLKADPRQLWIANTDADSTVPLNWLREQIDLAERGSDLVLGTVRLDDDAPPALAHRFARAYHVMSVGHQHVHAANLGIRASAYIAIGGWGDAALGEEHDLLERAGSADLRIARPGLLVITTSSRTTSRVLGGFASDLARLLNLSCPAGLVAPSTI